MQPPIHTLEDLYDSNGNFSITLCKYESMDINVYMYSLDYLIRSGHVCYHDQKQHLRRDDHRPQGPAVRESKAQYGHQGSG